MGNEMRHTQVMNSGMNERNEMTITIDEQLGCTPQVGVSRPAGPHCRLGLGDDMKKRLTGPHFDPPVSMTGGPQGHCVHCTHQRTHVPLCCRTRCSVFSVVAERVCILSGKFLHKTIGRSASILVTCILFT